mmetsp:Transcript_3429/g.8210  ORF Transcript_3429/g.8210 Transcript_3429/m.8210 type:complete len:334 (+) Transcript_3429:161-1162(+)
MRGRTRRSRAAKSVLESSSSDSGMRSGSEPTTSPLSTDPAGLLLEDEEEEEEEEGNMDFEDQTQEEDEDTVDEDIDEEVDEDDEEVSSEPVENGDDNVNGDEDEDKDHNSDGNEDDNVDDRNHDLAEVNDDNQAVEGHEDAEQSDQEDGLDPEDLIIRLRLLRDAYNKALANVTAQVTLEVFRSSLPVLMRQHEDFVTDLHGRFLDNFRANCQSEFEQLLIEDDIIAKLEAFEQNIANARTRNEKSAAKQTRQRVEDEIRAVILEEKRSKLELLHKQNEDVSARNNELRSQLRTADSASREFLAAMSSLLPFLDEVLSKVDAWKGFRGKLTAL